MLIWGLGRAALDELAPRAGAALADDHEPGQIGLSRDALAGGDHDSCRRDKAVLWLVSMAGKGDNDSDLGDGECLQLWLHA